MALRVFRILCTSRMRSLNWSRCSQICLLLKQYEVVHGWLRRWESKLTLFLHRRMFLKETDARPSTWQDVVRRATMWGEGSWELPPKVIGGKFSSFSTLNWLEGAIWSFANDCLIDGNEIKPTWHKGHLPVELFVVKYDFLSTTLQICHEGLES